MKRLILIVMILCIAATFWAASCIQSAEAEYVQAQRGPK